jgi:hypothetical protein
VRLFEEWLRGEIAQAETLDRTPVSKTGVAGLTTTAIISANARRQALQEVARAWERAQ